MDGWMDCMIDGWTSMGEEKDRWINSWMSKDGRMDEWMDGRK